MAHGGCSGADLHGSLIGYMVFSCPVWCGCQSIRWCRPALISRSRESATSQGPRGAEQQQHQTSRGVASVAAPT